jgi:hypothetical protein
MEQEREVEWVARCARRLRRQWHTLDLASLEDAARELWRDETLRTRTPEDAAAEWLRRGIPSA